MAMEGKNVSDLLDQDIVFHELIFHQQWRAMVTKYFDNITTTGVHDAMDNMLSTYDEPFEE